MNRYRIKKYTQNNGESYYAIERRIYLFFWENINHWRLNKSDRFYTESEALQILQELIDKDLKSITIININKYD